MEHTHVHVHLHDIATALSPVVDSIQDLRRDVRALASCGSVTQGDIDRLTITLTRSSDRLAAALKKAT